jgi:mRNA interferase RelE/StbE
MTKLRIPDHIATLIRGLHPRLKKKVKGALQALLSAPHAGKTLKEPLSGLRSFRVSRFRIIYRLSKKGYTQVVALGPRERIYEETYRIVSREEKNLSHEE